MDITVYLPDDLGQWAKAEGMNLSQTLRAAVQEERERRNAISETIEKAKLVLLDVVHQETGKPHKVRFTGTRIAHSERNDNALYLKDDGETLVGYNGSNQTLWFGELSDLDQEELRQLVDTDEEFIVACDALGITPILDI